MSGVNAMFAQCSTSMTSMSAGSAAGCGAGGAAAASSAGGGEGQLPNVSGALGMQSSILVQGGQQSGMDAMGALALGMLLGKGGGSQDKDKDDSWKMLAMMAMMGGMGQNKQSISFSQTTSQVQSSYAASAAGASTGSMSVQA
jgi:hypothetical protein